MQVETIILDNKKYVVLEEDIFKELLLRAESFGDKEKDEWHGLEDAKKISYEMIDRWAEEG